jgi:hypothetical protein
MMEELRRLWCSTRTTLTSGHATSYQQQTSGPTSSVDTSIATTRDYPILFAELDMRSGWHSIDRFASALNTLLPRYNAGWKDPTCEAVDAPRLLDENRRRENNRCNPPWPLLPNLVQKLRQSGASATIVAPRWTGKVWHHALTEMAYDEVIVASRRHLFQPGRRALRGTIGHPH